MKLRVVRVLVIEGEETWVKTVLEKSWVAPDRPQEFPNGTVTEVGRSTPEEIK